MDFNGDTQDRARLNLNDISRPTTGSFFILLIIRIIRINQCLYEVIGNSVHCYSAFWSVIFFFKAKSNSSRIFLRNVKIVIPDMSVQYSFLDMINL